MEQSYPYRLLAVLCCALLSGCTADMTREHAPMKTLTRNVRIAAGHESRTQLAPDGYRLRWSPGDRIGVFVMSGGEFTTRNAPMTFEGSVPAATGVFRGDLTLAEDAGDYTLYAYYPYDPQAGDDAADLSFVLSASQTQVAAGSSSHLGKYDFLVAEAVQSSVDGYPTLTFRHAFAVVEVELTATGAMAGKRLAGITLYCTDAATVDAGGNLSGASNMAGEFGFDLTAETDNNTATYRGGSAQIDYCRLTWMNAPTLGSEPVKAYLTINPANYAQGSGQIFVAVSSTDGYTATYALPGTPVAAGELRQFVQSVDGGVAPAPVVDLSGEGPRANCYIASQPSQSYSFDASVAGNGFVSQGLADAVQRYEGRTLPSSLAGTSARLLWQSNPRLVDAQSVRYEGGRIYFTLTDRPVSLGGNAVIGLYAGSDPDSEILWSWHIWITDKSNEELIAAAEVYTLSADYEQEYGPGSVQMMDRNLGAVYKEDGPYARSFRAPLYQWGRKDPMPWGKLVYDAQDAPHNYLAYRPPVVSTGSPGQYVGYTGNTHYATTHPDVFVVTTQSSSFDWYYGGGEGDGPLFRNNELWGNPTGYQVGQQTRKTLFDPCPPGWVMPHPYAFSGFTKTGGSAPANDVDSNVTGTFVQGWNFYYSQQGTTYYPGVGFRFDEFGVFAFAPSAYYWSSSPAPDNTFGAWVFGMTSEQIYQRIADPRGFGLPVRCMRDLPTP